MLMAEARVSFQQAGGAGGGGGGGGGGRGRSSRLKGEEVPESILFDDPEKIIKGQARERKRILGLSQELGQGQEGEEQREEEGGRVPETQLDLPSSNQEQRNGEAMDLERERGGKLPLPPSDSQPPAPPPLPPPPPPPREADPSAKAAALRLVEELVKGTEGWLLDKIEVLASKAAGGVKRFRREPQRTSVVGWLREELISCLHG